MDLLYHGKFEEDTNKYNILCEIAARSNNTDTILKYSEQAIDLAEKLDLSLAVPTILKGTAYLNSGRLPMALEYFMNAADYSDAENNNKGLARAYVYMAEAYNQQGDPKNEKLYLNRAIDIFRQEKDTPHLAAVQTNLGYANYKDHQYDTALALYAETIKIYQDLGSDYILQYAYCLGNTGLVYSRQEKYEEAEDYLLRAIEILEGQGDVRALTEYMIEYAGILQHQGNITKSKDFATLSFSNATKNGLIEYERDAAWRLSQLFQISGRYDSAYHYLSLYIQADDSITNEENILQMANLRTTYEVERREADIAANRKTIRLQHVVILSLAVILLLAVGLIMLYYDHLKKSRRLTSKLEERGILLEKQSTALKEKQEQLLQQKEELQSTLENLKKTQEQLIESEKMAAMGGLVAGVAHEMNTPVGVGITAVSNLRDDVSRMAELYEESKVSREEFKGFLESSDVIAKLIQKNLEKAASLIQSFTQISTDQVTEQQRVFACREYLSDIITSFRPKFSGKNIHVQIDCDDELTLNSYPGVYAQIFTNLLSNSLQHGYYKKDNGTITLKVQHENEILKILYSDDGVGISKKDLPHIFEPFYTSDKHRGTGLGLNIIYNLVRQKLHGTIACESEQGKGTLFRIEVPVR